MRQASSRVRLAEERVLAACWLPAANFCDAEACLYASANAHGAVSSVDGGVEEGMGNLRGRRLVRL